ncbi:MAG: adenosylmethionine decarboxylase [Patescibacteria group bacterium]
MHFGEHLTIDGYGGDQELLNNKEIVERALSELPTLLGMHTICEAVVVSAPANNLKDPGGWSGFVMIAESHISIHTFPARGFVSIDVYTCQNGLGIEKIKGYFNTAFSLRDQEINFIKRGTRYPEHNIY